MDIDQFLDGPVNASWTATVLEETGSTVYPGYGPVLRDATLEQLRASTRSLGQLLECAQQHEQLFLKHVVAVIKVGQGAPVEQAHRPGEGGDVRWIPVRSLGLSRDFLVPHMILFDLLMNDQAGLNAYLKATRNPAPKALARKYIDGFAMIRRDTPGASR